MRRLSLIALTFAACGGENDPVTVDRYQRLRTTPALRQMESCDELLGTLRDNVAEQTRVQLLQYKEWYGNSGGFGVDDGDVAAPEADAGGESAGASDNGSRQEGVDFSGTNNQETGVDEADFVKTDGYYIYVLNGDRLEILGVPTFGELEPVSSTTLEGWPTASLLAGDKIAVFSSVYAHSLPADHPLRPFVATDESGSWWYYSQGLVKLTLLDISDRAQPVVERELYLQGYYQTGRRIDSTVRMIAYSWMDIPGLRTWPELPENYWEMNDAERAIALDMAINAAIAHNEALLAQATLDDFVPSIYERHGETIITHPFTGDDCRAFAMADDGTSRGFTSLLTLDLLQEGEGFTYEADHIVSNWSTIYSSGSTLLVAEPAQDWWWFWGNDAWEFATNIHRFDVAEDGTTTYTGSGRVDGNIRNQFSLSELDGRVRVSTTSNPWNTCWMCDEVALPSNNVFVLEGADELKVVGEVRGIAEGETIWASRFVGDRGYLVTFRQMDPLWTVDLSNPTAPKILGELEVPGVSTYIHPLAGEKLLTIGFGSDENWGMNWSTSVSLFDVATPEEPALVDALALAPPPGDGWSYAWSEATYEHKAFQYWQDPDLAVGMLAVPLSTYRSSYQQTESGYSYTYEYASTLTLITVDHAGVTDSSPLSIHGTIDHSDFYNSEPGYWWYYRDIRRSIFMGDYIYAISDRGVTAHNTASLELSAQVPLDGYYDPCYGGCYAEGDGVAVDAE